MFKTNYLEIPIDSAIASFWKAKFPDLEDLFEGDNLQITIAPNSYRPIWEAASTVNQGYKNRYADLKEHRLEGFDVNLAVDCNCASVYYLLKDLEETSKAKPCGSFTGIVIHDYLLPDLVDIKADSQFTKRQVTIEVESSTGSMGKERDRSLFGTKVMFGILD